MKTTAVILAAGEGKRMHSDKSKTAHAIMGKPMIEWVYEAIKGAGIENVITVIGHKGEQIQAILDGKSKFAWQHEMKGTGHAVMVALPYIDPDCETVAVLCGDNPMLTAHTLKNLISGHEDGGNGATLISAIVDDPTGLGRIVRNADGTFREIREHRDAGEDIRKIKEINAGVYCFKKSELEKALPRLGNANNQGEYYLTDAVKIIADFGQKVGVSVTECSDEVLGINNKMQLAVATDIIKKRILEDAMQNGVTIVNTADTYIEKECIINEDTVIYPGVFLKNGTVVGKNCEIGPNVILDHADIRDGAKIVFSTIKNSVIEEAANVSYSVIEDCTVEKMKGIEPFTVLKGNSHENK